ncbi:hypothetical protein BDW59DRAFT_134100 [Aspergillus cavernicola]|uniref:XRCC4 coiled-coil domain-containing protein n=1 Tax=Aspergillus cavernicola TaxID=176166 RepID=A0ABR4HPW9_9EURO
MPLTREISTPRIIRIRRSDLDEANSFVLLHVSRSDSAALELKITATEGDCPYAATVRQSHLKKLKAKNYQGTDDEWKDTALYVLGLLEGTADKSDLLRGVEASASISGSGEDDKELVITVRKRIQTIIQKLGSLTLNQDDEQAIELFEWSNIAIARADSLDQRFNSLLERFRTAEDTINSLNKQLEEFVGSKSQHEQQLMSDFVQLLNEKKLKIRNQQRLLASANVDPDKLSTIQAATATDDPKPNAKGKGSKRSAKAISDESESEDGFEKMDVDESKQQADDGADEETDSGGRATPQPIEEEDDTTDDEESAPAVKDSQQDDKRRQRPPGRVTAKSPPPRRDLPFTRRTKESASTRSPSAQEDPNETGGETDDDDDDEL